MRSRYSRPTALPHCRARRLLGASGQSSRKRLGFSVDVSDARHCGSNSLSRTVAWQCQRFKTPPRPRHWSIAGCNRTCVLKIREKRADVGGKMKVSLARHRQCLSNHPIDGCRQIQPDFTGLAFKDSGFWVSRGGVSQFCGWTERASSKVTLEFRLPNAKLQAPFSVFSL